MPDSIGPPQNRYDAAAPEQISALAGAFDDSWRSGQPRPIEEFLQNCPASFQAELVLTLAKRECEPRLARGEHPGVLESRR